MPFTIVSLNWRSDQKAAELQEILSKSWTPEDTLEHERIIRERMLHGYLYGDE
jgi:hypothetical protein